MKTDAERFRRRADETLDKHVDETVERAIDAMPTRKRERLENELKSGADINVERKSV